MDILTTTKKKYIQWMREKIRTDKEWAEAALLKIYETQTESEKKIDQSCSKDGIGFNRYDAPVLNALARKRIENGRLTLMELGVVRMRVEKYVNQLYRIAKEKALQEVAAQNMALPLSFNKPRGRVKPYIRENVND